MTQTPLQTGDTAPVVAERELSEDELRLAYQLFLNRNPADREVVMNLEKGTRLGRIRRMFLTAPEFASRLERFLPNHDVRIAPKVVPYKTGRFLHLHIPKTAGTTLSAILGTNIGSEHSITVSENVKGPLGGKDPEELAKYRFIFGHLSYRAVPYLPADTTVLCVLRQPGDRLLSFYLYIQRTKDHPLHRKVVDTPLSFGEFLEFTATDLHLCRSVDNVQMRIISGKTEVEHLGQEPEIFTTAVSNLVTGRVLFGLTERFEMFQEYLKEKGIIQKISAARLNAADNPAVLDTHLNELTPAQREIFNQYTAWDQILYDICEKIDLGRSTEPATP